MIVQSSIFSYTQKSFVEEVFKRLKKGRQQAERLYAYFFQKGRFPHEEEWKEKQSYPLVQEIMQMFDSTLPGISSKQEEGSVVKFLLRFSDGKESETVAIPMGSGITLCLSSQVGCRRACAFCETGRMGLLRSLRIEEIIAQVFVARHVLGLPIKNLVFMGMGEPLDNLEAVIPALQVLTDPAGFGFGYRRITVSTSGVVDGIERLMNEVDPALHLAVSINAPNDEIRKRIMPINRKWNMARLKEVLVRYSGTKKRTILAEYVLLKEINDDVNSAQQLASYLEGLSVKVNVIPYNAQSNDRYAPPDEEVIDAFMAVLRKAGYRAFLRHSKGRKIMAACGQLGTLRS